MPALIKGFPDETTTGVKPGTVLKPHTGLLQIKTPGQVVENLDINGYVEVIVSDVTIRNCKIRFGGPWGVNGDSARNLTIENCEFIGKGVNGSGQSGCLVGGKVINCSFHDMTIAIQLKDWASVVRGNYIDNLRSGVSGNGDPPHYDGVTMFAGGPAEISYNTMNLPPGTACVFIAPQWNMDVHDIWVHHNLLYGNPSYTIYSTANPPPKGQLRNITIEDNYIERGGYGYILVENSNPTIRNNVQWDSRSDPLPPPPPPSYWEGAGTPLPPVTEPPVTEPPTPETEPLPDGQAFFFPLVPSPTPAAVNDTTAVELGMKFKPARDGVIKAIRYWKASGESGSHSGALWSATGQQLASVTFAQETSNGWQIATLATPVPVKGGTIYVVSYRSNGRYGSTKGYFAQAVTRGPLSAPVNAGVFRYGARACPTEVYQASNYWVDVLFAESATTEPPVVEPPPPNEDAATIAALQAQVAGLTAAVTKLEADNAALEKKISDARVALA